MNIKKRSILVAGHATSLSLENEFWLELVKIAKQKKLSLNKLITNIDKNRNSNLSSAVRVFILKNKKI